VWWEFLTPVRTLTHPHPLIPLPSLPQTHIARDRCSATSTIANSRPGLYIPLYPANITAPFLALGATVPSGSKTRGWRGEGLVPSITLH